MEAVKVVWEDISHELQRMQSSLYGMHPSMMPKLSNVANAQKRKKLLYTLDQTWASHDPQATYGSLLDSDWPMKG